MSENDLIERAREMVAWAIDGADDDFAFEILREGVEEGRVLTVGDLRDAISQAALQASGADQMRVALEAVSGAMLNGGDGATGDFGWSITKLNKARPLIRAALSATPASEVEVTPAMIEAGLDALFPYRWSSNKEQDERMITESYRAMHKASHSTTSNEVVERSSTR